MNVSQPSSRNRRRGYHTWANISRAAHAVKSLNYKQRPHMPICAFHTIPMDRCDEIQPTRNKNETSRQRYTNRGQVSYCLTQCEHRLCVNECASAKVSEGPEVTEPLWTNSTQVDASRPPNTWHHLIWMPLILLFSFSRLCACAFSSAIAQHFSSFMILVLVSSWGLLQEKTSNTAHSISLTSRSS